MHITPIKTSLVTANEMSILDFLETNLTELPENSILAVTSKIIALCENRILPLTEDRDTLIEQYSDYYLPKKFRLHGTCTITHHAFIGGAGIDESNADGHYVLLPEDSQKTARAILAYLTDRFHHKNIGVIITDSHSTPLRRGASGISLAYAGFRGLNDYRGTKDLFGRSLVMEQANIPDALAAGAVLVMGEGDEQTPLAVIAQIPNVQFDALAPTEEEYRQFFVPLEEDIFFPIFDMNKLTKGSARKIS